MCYLKKEPVMFINFFTRYRDVYLKNQEHVIFSLHKCDFLGDVPGADSQGGGRCDL
jgi:hypothetical protein